MSSVNIYKDHIKYQKRNIDTKDSSAVCSLNRLHEFIHDEISYWDPEITLRDIFQSLLVNVGVWQTILADDHILKVMREYMETCEQHTLPLNQQECVRLQDWDNMYQLVVSWGAELSVYDKTAEVNRMLDMYPYFNGGGLGQDGYALVDVDIKEFVDLPVVLNNDFQVLTLIGEELVNWDEDVQYIQQEDGNYKLQFGQGHELYSEVILHCKKCFTVLDVIMAIMAEVSYNLGSDYNEHKDYNEFINDVIQLQGWVSKKQHRLF